MSNLNSREIYDRETRREVYRDGDGEIRQDTHRDRTGETRQEVYRDRNGNLHTQTTRTPVNNGLRVDPAYSNPTAFRDGYAQGRGIEQQRQTANLRERDNDNAARGLLIGIVLTSLAGLALGSIFLFAQRNPNPTPASSPVVPTTAPVNPPTTNRETTIIERNNTRVIPVPQEPAAPPNVTITVPDSQQAPAQTAPSQTAPDPAQQPTQGTSGSSQTNGVDPVTPISPQGSTDSTTGTDSTGSTTAPSN